MLTETHKHKALMRVQEVARELGQHPATVYRKVAAGEIPTCVWVPVAQPSGFRVPSSSAALRPACSSRGRMGEWLRYRVVADFTLGGAGSTLGRSCRRTTRASD